MNALRNREGIRSIVCRAHDVCISHRYRIDLDNYFDTRSATTLRFQHLNAIGKRWRERGGGFTRNRVSPASLAFPIRCPSNAADRARTSKRAGTRSSNNHSQLKRSRSPGSRARHGRNSARNASVRGCTRTCEPRHARAKLWCRADAFEITGNVS